ncbi:GNAT family N-acetyltransferase [Azohydromonas aeria]|uniref:GNAT family N-acetyltransferase n=1 Tax=Azohydromonas aeria TaxID=2590212 RepID=UPI0012F95F2D|nr:GNAT family N-acetyltransferase [Azohydromonas aeria]
MDFIPITKDLCASPAVQGSDFLKGLCASVVNIYPEGTPVMPWAGYLVEENKAFIGTCAYKSPPVLGAVEIAYFTFPGHEGQGSATRMARHLVELAAENGVACVRAQTLPEKNASTRILEKLGFTLVGPVHHPEDGEVWEWQKRVADSQSGASR